MDASHIMERRFRTVLFCNPFVFFHHHDRYETNPQEQPDAFQAAVGTSHFQPKPDTRTNEGRTQ
jgi:hypothetical protein